MNAALLPSGESAALAGAPGAPPPARGPPATRGARPPRASPTSAHLLAATSQEKPAAIQIEGDSVALRRDLSLLEGQVRGFVSLSGRGGEGSRDLRVIEGGRACLLRGVDHEELPAGRGLAAVGEPVVRQPVRLHASSNDEPIHVLGEEAGAAIVVFGGEDALLREQRRAQSEGCEDDEERTHGFHAHCHTELQLDRPNGLRLSWKNAE